MLVGLGPTAAYKRRAKAPHNQTEYRDSPLLVTPPNPRTIAPQLTIPIQHTPMDLFATLSSIVLDTVTAIQPDPTATNNPQNCIVA